MKFLSILIVPFFVVVFLFACSAAKHGNNKITAIYQPAPEELYATIARMDSTLFAAFNNRDTITFKAFFTEDLEFYHDKGGLTNYTQTIESLKRTAASGSDLKRELIPGSLEVFPIKEYGAVQIGHHQFCHTENGKPDCGVFKFVHVWKKKEDAWKISRVISYDH